MEGLALSGKRVLVTGASKGIGAATAVRLGALGAAVAVHYRGDEEGARRVLGALEASGGRGVTVGAELATWSAAATLVERAAQALGGLDGLVVNHGIWNRAPIAEMTEAQCEEMLAVNLKGVMALCGSAARVLGRQGTGGSIVLVSSTAGQRGEAEHSHYAATKGAIISLTKSLAPELAPLGIRCNCVAPGWVLTPMTEGEDLEAVARGIPMRRVGRADEIAWAIAFMLSDVCGFANGEVLNANGAAVLCG